MKQNVEVDPEYHLYPYKRERIEPKDEIFLRNHAVGGGNLTMTRTVAGSFINNLNVPTNNLPGNFGVRTIETMPTNLSEIWRERKNTQLGFLCDPSRGEIP